MNSGNYIDNTTQEELRLKLSSIETLLGEIDAFSCLPAEYFLNDMYLLHCEFNNVVSQFKKLKDGLNDAASTNELLQKVAQLQNDILAARVAKLKELHNQFREQIVFLNNKKKEIEAAKQADINLYQLKTGAHDDMLKYIDKELNLYHESHTTLLDVEAKHDPNSPLTSNFLGLYNLVIYQKTKFNENVTITKNDIDIALGQINFSIKNQLMLQVKNRKDITNLASKYINKELALIDAYKAAFSAEHSKILIQKIQLLSEQRDVLKDLLKNVGKTPDPLHIQFKSIYNQIKLLQSGADDYFKHLEMFEIERRKKSAVYKSMAQTLTIINDLIIHSTKQGYIDRVDLLTPLQTELNLKLAEYTNAEQGRYKLFFTSTPGETDKKFKAEALNITLKKLASEKVNAICKDHKGFGGWIFILLQKIHAAFKASFSSNKYSPTYFATRSGKQMIKVINNIQSIKIKY